MLHRSLRRTAAALALAGAALSASGADTAPVDDTRTISFYHIHTKETLTVTYKRSGKYVPEALDKIDWVMRDWRKNEKTKMDPHTIDILWEMHTELGSKEPIHIICGYRSRSTNEMLRRTVGGQASESQHITGKAIDVTFPDVPLKQIRYSALIREQGGVGYYPTSGIPFVHVDTGRVRHWPRLPRYELALLFPGGKSQHHPADGGDITATDVRVAQAQHRDLATQIAAFFTLRNEPKPAVMVADATPPAKPVRPAVQTVADVKPAPAAKPAQVAALADVPQRPVPQLLAAPKLVERPSRLIPAPSEADRNGLAQLVSLVAHEPPKLVAGPAPAVRRKAGPQAELTPAVIPAVAEPARPKLAYDELLVPRTRWTQLAAIDPATTPEAGLAGKVISDAVPAGWSNGFAAAPAWDEEHPEELSYRPFPLAPLLTASASINEPALSHLTQPDVSRALRLIDQPWTVPEMQFSPGEQTAEIMWAQQFQGHPVQFVDASLAERGENIPTDLIPRAVKTTVH